jgi:hypothetical protein
MGTLPIAALIARDAIEQQFSGEQAAERPPRRRVRLAGARALRWVADRLEPHPFTQEAAPQARPATHRGSPC